LKKGTLPAKGRTEETLVTFQLHCYSHIINGTILVPEVNTSIEPK